MLRQDIETLVGKWASTGMGPPVVQDRTSQDKQVPVSSTVSPQITLKETATDTSLAVNVVQYISTKDQSCLVGLVGKRCMVSCFMGNHPDKVLWDTGVQSSIVNDPWRLKHLPHSVIRPISEHLEKETLIVLAANDMPITYIGWIEVSFRLDSTTTG